MDEMKINLTLDANEEKEAPKTPAVTAQEYVDQTLSALTDEEKQMVESFAEKIDVRDTNAILQYGASAQKHISDFSGTALESVKNKDMGEVGSMLTGLVSELKGFSTDLEAKPKGLRGLFKKQKAHIEELKIRYEKADVSVTKITDMLEGHQVTLMKDVATLDKLYENNLGYFKELSMYILAGKQALDKARETELVELRAKAEQSGLPEDAQAANDYDNMCTRFEKRIHDLELTRMVSIQMAPQIRLIQNNDSLMVEKIQSSVMNTIPLWKSQMLLALGMAHTQEAMEAQHAVTDMTNELLKKNAEKLQIGTIQAAKEAERGVVDIATLTETNEKLIGTLDEVLRIQTEGKEQRRAAEGELTRIEGELKEKLLELRG